MANRKINYDRGVIISQHKSSGMDVYMYVDTPGVYLNAFGTPIDEQLAKEAGFDVVKYGKDRVKRERMAAAMGAIEHELEIANEEGNKKTVKEQNGFKVIDIGLGRHYVEDPDGNRLTATPLPLEQSVLLLDKIAPPVKSTEGLDVKPKKAVDK